MKTAIIAFSRSGINRAAQLKGLYRQASIFVPPRLLGSPVSIPGSGLPGPAATNGEAGQTSPPEAGCPPAAMKNNRPPQAVVLNPLEGGLFAAMPDIFGCFRLIVFVSAAAVAVRAVAPCLKNKAEDPGVVVVDEQGRFAVSLLSGHLGGANEEARNIAGHINACAVITTATDGRGLPAFDDLARRWGWGIENLPELKGISAALLEGREVVLYSELPFNRELPGPVRVTAEPGLLRAAEHGFVVVSSREKTPPGPPGLTGLVLRPRNISAGVGCRRGVSAERIINAVRSAFREAGLAAESLCCLATGEFKAAEPGLVAAAGRLGVPLKVFTGEEIRGALGNSVQSNFVEEQVGVGAVAEPCARLGSGGGKIVLPTLRAGGITVALAEGSLFPSG